MAVNILYVDDELDLEILITQKFRKEIRKKIYNFVFAHDGSQALSILKDNDDISMVLSDINMPIMDGLTLLSKIDEMDNPVLKTVIVSAYGDMEKIRTAMNRGAFDFITKPIDFEDLETTINKTLKHSKFIEETLKARDKLVSLQADLDIARNIQLSLLPKTFPAFPDRKEFDIYAHMNAAKSIGGDLYDFFLINENELAIVIGDVCDKGIPAALFMAVSRTFLRAYGQKGMEPHECMSIVNNLLCKESINGMFVTVFYAIVNLKTGEIKYSNGGHNPPYIIRQDGTVEEIVAEPAMVLGVFEDIDYKTYSNQLNAGDSVYLFTDGVTESMDINRHVYSEERLEKLLSQSKDLPAQEIAEKVIEDVDLHAKNAEQFDDITMLSLNYLGN